MKINSLPSNYLPPKKMIVGSNEINNVNALISFKSFAPILIGDGEIPHIWLNVPTNKDGTEWYPLVKDNFSTNPSVIVIKTKKGIKITTPDGIVIDCTKEKNGTINVQNLNLRPFGLNVFSDKKSMNIMGSSFSSNTFSNSNVVIGLG